MFFDRRKKHTVSITAPKFRRHKVIINWRRWFFVLVVISLLAGFSYLIIWSPVFKIRKISVESAYFTAQAQTQEIVSQLLQEKLWRVIPGDSLFTFLGQEASRRILSSFPEAESVVIKRSLTTGPEIKIEVKGRQSAAIWCQSLPVETAKEPATTTVNVAMPTSDKCFFADESGFLFHEAPTISGIALPTFFSQINEKLDLRSQAIASSTIQFASQLKKQLREEIGVDTLGFRAGAVGSQDLEVFVDEGWLIYFNMERPPSAQVKVLGVLLAGDLKDKRAELKYVDLRVAGKVYYK